VATVGAIVFSGWREEAAFDEGVSRFESALRLARTESANLGLRVRLSFDANGTAHVLYEPQPLEAPGEFVDYAACAWRDVVSGGLARVTRCELTGGSVYRAPTQSRDPFAPEDALPALTFYPDGSCEAALVELSPVSETDPRRAVVELDGEDGSFLTHRSDADALEDTYEQIRLARMPQPPDTGTMTGSP